ncbi:MAG: GAF domain-containing protein [Candidatus Sumerlaeia bacterium]|nr:GAF domain-containing protein [Candidatus Sumerlaeia bacterium]
MATLPSPNLQVPSPPPAEGINASLFAICQAISSTLELQPLLELILDLTTRELEAPQGSILLIDRESDELKMLASRGLPREVVERGYIPRRGSIAEWVIEHAEPVLLDDKVVSDPRFESIVTGRAMRSSMCVPLQAKGRVIGTINVTRPEGGEHFTADDLSVLQIMASQAAVAIENARLHSELVNTARLATLGQTVSGISHCIKNILTGVKGGMALVEMAFEEADISMRDRGWEMLKRNINRISLLVLDMLDFSKARKPIRSGVELHSLIQEVFDTLATRAAEAQVSLEVDLPPDIPPVLADPDQFFRCLLNVVGNGIDACMMGGSVTVRALHLYRGETAYRMFKTDGVHDYTVLEIADTGCGIPPHLLDQIFDPFYSTKGSKGTGLGMPVTKKILEEHGGTLEIDSEPGRGTTIRFILPQLPDSGTPSQEAAPCSAQ